MKNETVRRGLPFPPLWLSVWYVLSLVALAFTLAATDVEVRSIQRALPWLVGLSSISAMVSLLWSAWNFFGLVAS